MKLKANFTAATKSNSPTQYGVEGNEMKTSNAKYGLQSERDPPFFQPMPCFGPLDISPVETGVLLCWQVAFLREGNTNF